MGIELQNNRPTEQIATLEVEQDPTPNGNDLQVVAPPPRSLGVYTGPDAQDVLNLLTQAQNLTTMEITDDPDSIAKARDQIYNVIEQLTLMLAREENKAKHDRFRAKIQKLQEHVNKLLQAAEQQLIAGKEEVNAAKERSIAQLVASIVAIVVIVAVVALTIAFPPGGAMLMAGVIGAGAAAGGIIAGMGGPIGEALAKDDMEDKHEAQAASSEFNAFATEIQKLMETEGELEGEAAELLRKLLNTLLKIAEQISAVRSKQAETL